MIVWINGAFGSGKTHAAYELNRRLSESFVFDPEETGFFMQANMPESVLKSDFQDYKLWRRMNYDMLSYIARKYQGVIIVPMTITDEIYYHDMITQLEADVQVCHLTLRASKETIKKRLKRRGDKKNAWSFDQVDRCVEAFQKTTFESYIDTDHLSIDEVVEAIADHCQLDILPEKRSPLKKKWDRLLIWCHHKRWL